MKSIIERGRLPARLVPALVLTGLLAAIVSVAAVAATSRSAVKPSNASAPTIGGTASESSTLTVSNGNWDGTAPITYTYQWRRCDSNGGSCSSISGATQATYVLKQVDDGNTLRVQVKATNADGSSTFTTVPTAVVTAAPTTPAPPATGCPSTASGATVNVSDLSSPARLQIDQFQSTPTVIAGNMDSFSVRVHVGDTCGQTVSGAAVYATAVPFNQVSVPAETQTGSDGWVTLQFHRLGGFPATAKQRLMVMFLRARMPGQSPLAGITTSRLVSFRVNLHASV